MKKYPLIEEEKKILSWLTKQRELSDEYYGLREICKATDRCWNKASYQMVYRLCAYDLVEHKVRKKSRASFVSVFRRVKKDGRF